MEQRQGEDCRQKKAKNGKAKLAPILARSCVLDVRREWRVEATAFVIIRIISRETIVPLTADKRHKKKNGLLSLACRRGKISNERHVARLILVTHQSTPKSQDQMLDPNKKYKKNTEQEFLPPK